MKRIIKQRRNADARVSRAAAAFIDEARNDSPRLWMGKRLFDLQMRLGRAIDARRELGFR